MVSVLSRSLSVLSVHHGARSGQGALVASFQVFTCVTAPPPTIYAAATLPRCCPDNPAAAYLSPTIYAAATLPLH